MNLQELINNLPLELIYKIMSYILKPQPKFLLEDIKNYYESKKIGYLLYSNRFEEEPGQIANWFANDICSYMNCEMASMYGYVEKYYDIFFRLKQLVSKQDILSYTFHLEKDKVEREINVKWALLLPKERMEMIKTYYTKEEINLLLPHPSPLVFS